MSLIMTSLNGWPGSQLSNNLLIAISALSDTLGKKEQAELIFVLWNLTLKQCVRRLRTSAFSDGITTGFEGDQHNNNNNNK